MKIGRLDFNPIVTNSKLVTPKILKATNESSYPTAQHDFLVAEIDPQYINGADLCSHYDIDPKIGANCLIVDCIRGVNIVKAACLVPVGFRYDMSGTVRKYLGVRRVSVAPLEDVLQSTGMEYGSITPIGLPHDWLIFIDPMVMESERIVIGGGLVKSKISIPSKALLSLPNATILNGLAKI